MHREIAFPNPVERHDLPKPRRKWRYIFATLALLALMMLVFLPQIFSSRAGRKIVKIYLENKYRGTVWVQSISTSWSGPTSITGFSLTDPEGRQVRFKQLDSQLTMWDLLTGNLDLKTATVRELYIEYVIDYGDGTDWLDRIDGDWEPGSAPPAPAAGAAAVLPSLPKISGDITLHNSTFILIRGQIQQDQGFRTVYRSVKFSGIEGTLAIDSLDKPWEVELEGKVGPDNSKALVSLAGKLDLGEAGKLDVARMTADLKVRMRDIPNEATAGAGSLLWALFPLIPAEDVAEAFGPTLQTMDVDLKAADGVLDLENLSIIGKTAAGRDTRLTGHPVLDLTKHPRVLGVAGPTSASVALTREMAFPLAFLNPFLADAAGGGHLDLTVTKLSLPLIGTQKKMVAEGTYTLDKATLASGQVGSADPRPRELTTQWQALEGDTGIAVTLSCPPTQFTVQKGAARAGGAFTLNDQPITLSGEIALDGKLTQTATLPSPPALRDAGADETLTLSVTGNLEQPRIDLSSATQTPTAADVIEKNVVTLAQRRRDRLLQTSARRVEAMLEPFDKMEKDKEKPKDGGK